MILFYILLRTLSWSFIISLKGIPSGYALLIIDKLPVEYSLLIPYYIYLYKLPIDLSIQGISSQFCFLYIFLSWIIGGL